MSDIHQECKNTISDLVDEIKQKEELIEQKDKQHKAAHNAITLIEMHNGSINSFDEIERIIEEYKKGADS